jgi:hypothetical protein
MSSKAYLSGGPRHSDDSQPDTWNMAHAVKEARSILADVETLNNLDANKAYVKLRGGTSLTRSALVDSLAAFVALEIS